MWGDFEITISGGWHSVEGRIAFGSTHMRKSKRLFPRWFLKVEIMHVTSCHSYRLIDMLYIYIYVNNFTSTLYLSKYITIYCNYCTCYVAPYSPKDGNHWAMMYHHPNQKKTLLGEGAAFCNLLSNPDITNPFGLFVKNHHITLFNKKNAIVMLHDLSMISMWLHHFCVFFLEGGGVLDKLSLGSKLCS